MTNSRYARGDGAGAEYTPGDWADNGYPAAGGWAGNGFPAGAGRADAGYPARGQADAGYPAGDWSDTAYPGREWADTGYPAGGQADNGFPARAGRSDTRYTRGDQAERKRSSGGVVIAGASTLAAVLVILAIYALGIARRPTGAPGPPPAASTANAELTAFAHSYLAIADPSDRRLNVEEDGYADDERGDLVAAEADLRAEVATERLFDKQLAAIKFPPAIEAAARALTRANQSRFRVTERQARSKTLARLQSLDSRRKAGDDAVEAQVRLLRQALHLPPAPTS